MCSYFLEIMIFLVGTMNYKFEEKCSCFTALLALITKNHFIVYGETWLVAGAFLFSIRDSQSQKAWLVEN